jgi:PA domain/Secretion system C-terminal sorting domain
MKKSIFSVLMFSLCCVAVAFGQTTPNLQLIVTAGTGKPIKLQVQSGAFGDSLRTGKTLVGDIALSKTADADALVSQQACGKVVNDLKGKFALVRRGVCNFDLKCRNAQLAGATAVIVYNHTAAQALIFMGAATDSVKNKITIPVGFISNEDGEALVKQLAAGTVVKATYRSPGLSQANAAFARMTPKSQLLPLDSMEVIIGNPNNTAIPNVVNTVLIKKPDGKTETLTTPAATLPNKIGSYDINFPTFKPTDKGEYTFTFTCSIYPEDTIVQKLVVTDNIFGLDDGNVLANSEGLVPNTESYITGKKRYHVGAIYRTNATTAVATQATFGLSNAITAATKLKGREIAVILYDLDPKATGKPEHNTNPAPQNYDRFKAVAFGSYLIKGTEKKNELLNVVLESADGAKKVNLKANGYYLVSAQYDCAACADTIAPAFTFAGNITYPDLASTVVTNSFYWAGWQGNAQHVLRLQLESIIIAANDLPLENGKVSVYPNPVKNLLTLELAQDAPKNNKATVELFDINGVLFRRLRNQDVASGRILLDTSDFASGVYIVSVKTEGFVATKKFVKE